MLKMKKKLTLIQAWWESDLEHYCGLDVLKGLYQQVQKHFGRIHYLTEQSFVFVLKEKLVNSRLFHSYTKFT